jgi:hypothetical protein
MRPRAANSASSTVPARDVATETLSISSTNEASLESERSSAISRTPMEWRALA